MKVSLLFLIAVLSSFAAAQNSGCSASVVALPRIPSWPAGNGATGVIYDLQVTNTGSCALDSVDLGVSVPFGATIQEPWGLVYINSESYELTLYTSLAPGDSVGGPNGPFGFIAILPAGSLLVTVTDSNAVCEQCP